MRHVFGREERALEIVVVVEGVGKGEEEVRHVEQGRESWRERKNKCKNVRMKLINHGFRGKEEGSLMKLSNKNVWC